MGVSTINISIPEKLKAEVEEIIADEGYGNTSEFFRDLVRKYIKERREKRLESLLLQGLERLDAAPLTGSDLKKIKVQRLADLKAHLTEAVKSGGLKTSKEVTKSVESKLRSLKQK